MRLFVAAAVPEPLLGDLQSRLDELAGHFPGARWTDPATRHITLKFLGPTLTCRLPEVEQCCDAVAFGSEPCELRLEGLGAFPRPARATVLWAGVSDDTGTLVQLAVGLDGALAPMGFPTEPRPFVAHLTLARFRRPARLDLPDLGALGPFSMDQIVLFQSRLSRGGARYTALTSFALGRRGTA